MSDCCCGSSEDKAVVEEVREDACCCGGSDPKSDTQSESTCCCGDSSDSDCCCDDGSYSCEDDAYAGPKRTAVVDFLYIDLQTCDRCQGADERVALAVERCRPILAACGYNLVLNMVLVEDEAAAERWRFYSSPTVRANGVDICPSVEENDCDCCSDIAGVDVKCRIFPFNGTYYEVPPTDMLVRGIMETVMRDERYDPTCEPYELPENLRAFFEGKRAKDEKGAEDSCCCC